ncbi:Uncharacterised protein [Mycobacteroides abscessus subsp. abscessus]|nr:Uncharacterised protein [Mycobacteroides abscessus subsp. abscessus]
MPEPGGELDCRLGRNPAVQKRFHIHYGNIGNGDVDPVFHGGDQSGGIAAQRQPRQADLFHAGAA